MVWEADTLRVDHFQVCGGLRISILVVVLIRSHAAARFTCFRVSSTSFCSPRHARSFLCPRCASATGTWFPVRVRQTSTTTAPRRVSSKSHSWKSPRRFVHRLVSKNFVDPQSWISHTTESEIPLPACTAAARECTSPLSTTSLRSAHTGALIPQLCGGRIGCPYISITFSRLLQEYSPVFGSFQFHTFTIKAQCMLPQNLGP